MPIWLASYADLYTRESSTYFANVVEIKRKIMINECIVSQAALMMVICNYLLDDRDRRSEGEIKEMYFDLMDMIEE